MNLSQAIEIQKEILVRGSMIDDPDDINAIKLLIEAGERLLESRKLGIKSAHVPLLGEIED